MYTVTKTGKGYSLVEVLIAISILMIAIVGPLTIAAKSIQTAQYARQQTTAFFLAQEGITIINIIRNENALQAYNNGTTNPWAWASGVTVPPPFTLAASCFTLTGCGIDFSDSTLLSNDVTCNSLATNPCIIKLRPVTGNPNVTSLYTHVNAGSTPTPYSRIIRLTRPGTNEVMVEVEVRWNTRYLGGTTQSVILRTSLFNIYEDL